MKPASISIVVPTDTIETVMPVVNHLQQVIADDVEIVVVLPDGDAESARQLAVSRDVRVVAVPDSIYPLSSSRAAGVRAASAPYVFIGETHSFPRKGMFQALLDAHQRGWAVAVPAFENENPDDVVSWAGFLNGYAAWTPGRNPEELRYAPLFNVSYRRSFLIGLGDDLDHALTTGEDMMGRLHTAGLGVWYEPSGTIGHVNISRLGAWLSQRLVAGRVIAAIRSARWSLGKRIAFAIGSPLIPFVLFRRIRGGISRSIQRGDAPVSVVLLLVLGMFFQATGECLGYSLGMSERHGRRYDEFEVRQISFSSWSPSL